MLQQAFRDFPVATRENTIIIGDASKDIAVGQAFGIPTILVKSHEDQETTEVPDFTANSLLEAVELISRAKETASEARQALEQRFRLAC